LNGESDKLRLGEKGHMATILVNGCFDLLHGGHRQFLFAAKHLGITNFPLPSDYVAPNRLIVAVNSDEMARTLKSAKWGEKYPIDDLETRMHKLTPFADEVVSFDSEDRLHELIEFLAPCILVKGPDYTGKAVTGDDIAPVIILDTPEPESVKQMKIEAYSKR
jgi:D-beta-D-heptose 7-phosphate kinase/D-beta-D-heptose 1-phosphate adenosyltransferase